MKTYIITHLNRTDFERKCSTLIRKLQPQGYEFYKSKVIGRFKTKVYFKRRRDNGKD